MENVTPSQRWGVSGGVPAGDGGVEERLAPAGQRGYGLADQQRGLDLGAGPGLPDGRAHTGNPTEQYGVSTIDGLAALVWRA